MSHRSAAQGRSREPGPWRQRWGREGRRYDVICVAEKYCADSCDRQRNNTSDTSWPRLEESVAEGRRRQTGRAIFRWHFGATSLEQTCRKKVIGCWPMACASPILALMTSANGFFTPCTAKQRMIGWQLINNLHTLRVRHNVILAAGRHLCIWLSKSVRAHIWLKSKTLTENVSWTFPVQQVWEWVAPEVKVGLGKLKYVEDYEASCYANSWWPHLQINALKSTEECMQSLHPNLLAGRRKLERLYKEEFLCDSHVRFYLITYFIMYALFYIQHFGSTVLSFKHVW